MADLLQLGADMLQRRFKSSASHAVTYRRGQLSGTWNATAGRASYPVDGAESINVAWNERDYVGAIAELRTVFGSDFEPEKSDQIIDTINGFRVTYELRGEDGEPPFKYCDEQGQTRIRVHCICIARVPA
jgi:hypothetical protein